MLAALKNSAPDSSEAEVKVRRSTAAQRSTHARCEVQELSKLGMCCNDGHPDRAHVFLFQLVVDLLRQHVLDLYQERGQEGNTQHRQAELSVPVLVPSPREVRVRRLDSNRRQFEFEHS